MFLTDIKIGSKLLLILTITVVPLLAELQCFWKTNPKRFLKLNNDLKLPRVGYGTWKAKRTELRSALHEALMQGYRNIDTSPEYDNEEVVGDLVQRWYGNITRSLLFVTSKLPVYANHPSLVEKYVTQSVEKMQLRHIDMVLLSAPFGTLEHEQNEDGSPVINFNSSFMAVWRELERHYNYRQVRGIGLANFNQTQIEIILKEGYIVPAILQVELHVYLQQKELVKFCQKNGIVVQAYATLGSRGTANSSTEVKLPESLLQNKVVLDVAKRNNKTASQILLRHMIQQDISVLVETTNFDHMAEYTEVINYKLSKSDMAALDKLDRGEEARIMHYKDVYKGIEKHPEYPFPVKNKK